MAQEIKVAKILTRTGLKASLPQPLSPGEFGTALDTGEVFIGLNPTNTSANNALPIINCYASVVDSQTYANQLISTYLFQVDLSNPSITNTDIDLANDDNVTAGFTRRYVKVAGRLYISYEYKYTSSVLDIPSLPNTGLGTEALLSVATSMSFANNSLDLSLLGTYTWQDTSAIASLMNFSFTPSSGLKSGLVNVEQNLRLLTEVDLVSMQTTNIPGISVNGIKNLQPVANAVQYVIGFYENSVIGSGNFKWDATADKALHNGGTIIAPEALDAWDGSQSNLNTLLNWSGTGNGCFISLEKNLSVMMFGATSDGIHDDTLPIESAFNFVNTLINGTITLGAYHKITRSIKFRKYVTVVGNGSWILNYGNEDACIPHPDDGIVLSKISGFNVTYRDYGSPLNPNSPPYTIDKTKKLGNQIVWSHMSSFVADGLKHSTSGRFFQDFERINVYWHRYGFHMLGWTIQGRNCRAMYNTRGFFGSNASINTVRYPVHALQLNDCHAISNTEHGVDIRFADGVNLKGCHCEKNYSRNIRAEGIRGLSIDQFYQEYSDSSILLFNSQGIDINGYSSGNRRVYKGYAKTAQSYYEQTIVSGTSVTILPYDSLTKIGIDNFTSVPTDEIAVIKNDGYVLPTDWSRSGSTITIPSVVAGDVISVIAYAYRNPVTELNATHDKYELGTHYPLEVQHAQNVQFGGFVTSYRTGPAQTNDFDLPNLAASKDIYYSAFIKDTTVYNVPAMYYPWGTGFDLKQDFYRGLAIKNDTDTNVDVSFTGTQHYPQIGQVGTISLPNAKATLFMIISGNGCAIFTFDGNGNIYSAAVSSQNYSIQQTNAAATGKLNLYSAGANVLGFDNRLGYATQFTLLRISDN